MKLLKSSAYLLLHKHDSFIDEVLSEKGEMFVRKKNNFAFIEIEIYLWHKKFQFFSMSK